MTCIVAIAHKGVVYMGGDSAGIAGLNLIHRADAKVFINGDFIIGSTTSFRMHQLLQYSFKPPKQTVKDDMAYMVTDFVDAVRKCFAAGGFGRIKSDENNEGGTFLVGYRGNIYRIEGDFQVGQAYNAFDSVGCGALTALGSLYSSKGAPKKRIKLALEAASKFSAGVHAPFIIKKKS